VNAGVVLTPYSEYRLTAVAERSGSRDHCTHTLCDHDQDAVLEALTLKHFEPLIDEAFELNNQGQIVLARLIEARAGVGGSDRFRAPFSLVIRAEMPRGHYWPQGT
jgi:hypothetical protein